jgi:6-phosphogluconolactonase (cycloisomerase 2 family)
MIASSGNSLNTATWRSPTRIQSSLVGEECAAPALTLTTAFGLQRIPPMARTTAVITTFLFFLARLVASASSTPVVTVTYPANGATVHGPVYYAASASSPSCPKGIASMRIYSAPYISAYTVNAAQFSTFLNLAAGTYNTVVQTWDYCGGVGKTPITVTVSSSGGVTVYTPTINTAWASPIHFVASASANSICTKGIASIRIYSAPSVKAYTVNSSRLDTFLSLPSGSYNSTLQAWDKCGGVYKTPITVTAQNSPGRTLYMASSDLDYVSQYAIGDGGYLSPAIQLPMLNGPPQDFVTDRPGMFAYATVPLGIEAFTIDRATGGLVEVAGSPFPAAGSGPFRLAMDPQGNFIYVTFSGSDIVSSYRINRNTGALKLNGSAAAGKGSGAVKTDPSGKFLYVANSSDNTVSAFVIDWTTGALKPVPGSPFVTGVDPNVFTTSNSFLYVFGGNAFGVEKSISGYAIDTLSGVLTPVPGSPFKGHGSPANYIAVDAVHNILYQPTFPAPSGDAFNINAIDPATGTITFVEITGEFQQQDAETMLVDLSGDYLYMIDLWAGGTSNSPTAVGSFAINAVTGQLSVLGTHYETASHNSYASLAVVP